MAKDKPKIAASVIKIKSNLDPRKTKRFSEQVQVNVAMALAKEGLQALPKTREGYEVRLALDGPNTDADGKGNSAGVRMQTDIFLLSAETGKRIANETFGFSVRVEDNDLDTALTELSQKLRDSHAVRRIAAAALKDAEEQAGGKKKK